MIETNISERQQPLYILKQYINRLNSQRQPSNVAQRQASLEIDIINWICDIKDPFVIYESLKLMSQSLTDINFVHILRYLFGEQQFTTLNYMPLLEFLSSCILCQPWALSQEKQDILFKFFIQQLSFSSASFLTLYIKSYCFNLSNAKNCYLLINKLRKSFESMDLEKLIQVNLNQITGLSLRILRNYQRMPDYLVNQCFGFITKLFMPLAQQQANTNENILNQLRNIVSLILDQIIRMNNSKRLHNLGYAYDFIVYVIMNGQQIYTKRNQDQIIPIFVKNIEKTFPKVEQDLMFEELQKLTQEYEQKTKQQIDENILFELKVKRKLKVSLLRGISQFITTFFRKRNNNILIMKNSSDYSFLNDIKWVDILSNVMKMLSICNDKVIFRNFIQFFQVRNDFTDTFIIQQIVNNCPNVLYAKKSVFQQQNLRLKQSLSNILNFYGQDIRMLSNIVQIIKANIQKQYDQTFNAYQFSSACQLLCLMIQISCLPKQQIIQFIKILLNLNQSCLTQHKHLIIKKTYQIICQSFDIILPGNQYLQQVVEKQIVEKFEQNQGMLDRLVAFYQKKRDVIAEGSGNIFAIQDSFLNLHNLHQQHQPHLKFNAITNHQKVQANIIQRINSLIQLILNKLLNINLQFKHKLQLWKILYRLEQIKNQSQNSTRLYMNKKNQMLDLFFTNNLNQLAPKYISLYSQYRLSSDIFSLQITKLIEKMQIWPIFYQDQLKQMANLIQRQI